MLWIVILIGAILSGILYRLGGWGGEGRRKYPDVPTWLFDTKARDIGCSAVVLGCSAFLFPVAWYWMLLSFLLLFGALTTYWDFMFNDVDNHWMHGFMCGLAYFPYAIDTGLWAGFGVRCIALALLMGAISKISGNDVVEEVGRGALLILTLPCVFLFGF